MSNLRYVPSVLVRALVIFLLTFSVAAVQRPDTKTTMKNLARLPRMELRFSLDFEADRGFPVFRTSKDPAIDIPEMQRKLNGSASDARTWLELGALRLEASDFAAARREFQRSADAARKRLDVEPGNARLRLDLAQALHALSRQAEAESILREAVKTGPNSATNWLAFSAFLEARAWEIVTDTSNWRGRRPYGELCRAAVRRQATSETADRAARLLDESISAARQAVKLKDDWAQAHHRLGVALASRDCLDAVRRRVLGKETSAPLDTMIFSRAALEHFENAAGLDSENPIRVATLLLWRAMVEASERRLPVAMQNEAPVWEFFSDENRRKIQQGLERLAEFESSSSGGEALQAHGTLRFILKNDLRGAADDLRSAAGIIPDSEQLWETLTLVLFRRQDYFEMAAICEARTLVRSTIRNRLLLAKAHEKLGNPVRALEEAISAIALNPNDFSANVALANLLLKLSEPSEVSPRVRQSLVNAERAIRTTGTGTQYVDLALTQAIYHSLLGETDRAREILKAALAYSKDNPDLSTALNAIGY